MEIEEIKLSDWQRILFGEVPPSFFIEVTIRTVLVFILLVVSMRLFGRRMAAQINRIEMVALFSLAAAIGVPLQTPDKGVLPALVIAFVVILVGRLIAAIAYGKEGLQSRFEDKLTILASDGIIDMKKMKGTKLTLERVYAQLRKEGIIHLGQVRRLYLEANGSFSIIRNENPSCGLCILPENDREFIDEQAQCDEKVCASCGRKKNDNGNAETCNNCSGHRWSNAVI